VQRKPLTDLTEKEVIQKNVFIELIAFFDFVNMKGEFV
jgi:hypothetical protein